MNKIILASLCAVVLFAFSCRLPCHIDLEKPADIKPIDWEGYNDVYTVFWNILTDNCRGAGYPTGDTIMVYGKISADKPEGSQFFALIDEQEQEYNQIFDLLSKYVRYPGPCVYVTFTDEVRKKLDTCDLTKRCYIKEDLMTGALTSDQPSDNCCFTVPQVHLKNIDNIYFEEENENDDE